MEKINKKQNNKDLFNSIIIQMEKLRDLYLENLSKSLKDEKEQNIKTLINTFLQNGGDINARLSNNTHNQNATMLHVACLYGLTSIVQFLIDNGADINVQNAMGETPIMQSAFNIEILKLLIKNKADISIKNKNNDSLLENSINMYWVDAIKFIIKQYPDEKYKLSDKFKNRLKEVLDYSKKSSSVNLL